MEFEPMEDFEQELRQALERRPAPPGLKRKVTDARRLRRTERLRSHKLIWQQLAASVVLAGVVCGGIMWHERDEERKGEAAREQVLTALRITGHALNTVKTQLAGHDRTNQDRTDQE